MHDPFANYVVQFIMDLHVDHITEIVLRHMKTDLIALSRQKFSSNVIEKCLDTVDEDQATDLIGALMKQTQGDYSCLISH